MLLPHPLTLFIDRLPVAVVQRLVSQVYHRVMRQHPDLLDRLGNEANKRFCFAPTDLDLDFFIHPASTSLRTFKGQGAAQRCDRRRTDADAARRRTAYEGVSALRDVYAASPDSNGFPHGVAGIEWVAA